MAALSWPLNPSSIHGYGQKARAIVESARADLVGLIGAQGAEVVFTASGTEANHLAIGGLEDIDVIITSEIEHQSILKTAKQPYVNHPKIEIVGVDKQGLLDMNALEESLQRHSGKRILVSIMLANNETGVIQDVPKISKITYKHGGFMHTDAAQAVGKIEVDFTRLNVDMMSICGHKFGAPQGVGALVYKKGLKVHPVILGGEQEYGIRAGTENVAAIAGLGAAAKYFNETGLKTQHFKELQQHLEDRLHEIAGDVVIFSDKAPRLPNTTCFSTFGLASRSIIQMIQCDLVGIAVSSGSACSSGTAGGSHVLEAMGVGKELASRSIRVSTGFSTAIDDMDYFVDTWSENLLRKRKSYKSGLTERGVVGNKTVKTVGYI